MAAAYGLVASVIALTATLNLPLSPKFLLYAALPLMVLGVFCDWGLAKTRPRLQADDWIFDPAFLFLSMVPLLWSLFHAWEYGCANYYLVGGILPYSDANGYVNGAKSLLTFGELNQFAARRPLGVFFTSSLLLLTGDDIKAALVLQTVIVGMSLFAATREIRATGGVTAALGFLLICHYAISEFVTLFMTEAAGFALGAAGFAILLRGFRLKSLLPVFAGYSMVALGLTVRSGAFFLIPFLGLFIAMRFGGSLGQKVRLLMAGAAIAIAVLLISPLVLVVTAPQGSSYQGNFSYTLYGLAAGGMGWQHVMTKHPEIADIHDDGEKSDYIYTLAFEKISEEPLTLPLTLGRMLVKCAIRSPELLYGLSYPIPYQIPGTLFLVALPLLIRTSLFARSSWDFLLPALVGILLSAPFLLDGGSRVFATTFPFNAALAVVPISLALGAFKRNVPQMGADASFNSVHAGIFASLAAFMLLSMLVGSLRPRFLSQPIQQMRTAANHERLFLFSYHPSNVVALTPYFHGSPFTHRTRKELMDGSGLYIEEQVHLHANEGSYLMPVFDLNNRHEVNQFLILTTPPPHQPGWFEALAVPVNDQTAHLFTTEALRRVSE